MRTLALILARGGSKRLPGKNIKPLLDKPLIGWSIESALKTKAIDKVLVSTDSVDIQKAALAHGAEVPFLRPDFLSGDKATSVDAALHALNYAEVNWGKFDAVLLLEPTSPLRHRKDLTEGLELLKNKFNEADGVVSLGLIHLENPLHCKTIHNGYIIPLTGPTEGTTYYFPYGVMYLVKAEILKNKKTFYTDRMLPYVIERWQNYEVDDIYDFMCVESILKHKLEEVL